MSSSSSAKSRPLPAAANAHAAEDASESAREQCDSSSLPSPTATSLMHVFSVECKMREGECSVGSSGQATVQSAAGSRGRGRNQSSGKRAHTSSVTSPTSACALVLQWHPFRRCFAISLPGEDCVHVYNTGAQRTHTFSLHVSLAIPQFNWHPAGALLCVLGANRLFVCSLLTGLSEEIILSEVGYSGEMCFIRWAEHSYQLAVGTTKGEMLLYDYETQECSGNVNPTKQRRRIVCGDFSATGKLAYASDDRQITILNEQCVAIGHVKVKSRPTSVKFGGSDDSIVGVSMERKTILLYDLNDPENALELAFQQRYGNVIGFDWFDMDKIMVAFSQGFLVSIITDQARIRREQACRKVHSSKLLGLAYNASRRKAVTCNRNCFKLIDVDSWDEEVVEYINGDEELHSTLWCHDGSFLAVTTRSGRAHILVVHPIVEDAIVPTDPSKTVVRQFSCITFVLSLFTVVLVAVLTLSMSLRVPVSHVLTVFVDSPTL